MNVIHWLNLIHMVEPNSYDEKVNLIFMILIENRMGEKKKQSLICFSVHNFQIPKANHLLVSFLKLVAGTSLSQARMVQHSRMVQHQSRPFILRTTCQAKSHHSLFSAYHLAPLSLFWNLYIQPPSFSPFHLFVLESIHRAPYLLARESIHLAPLSFSSINRLAQLILQSTSLSFINNSYHLLYLSSV